MRIIREREDLSILLHMHENSQRNLMISSLGFVMVELRRLLFNVRISEKMVFRLLMTMR
jgi:hypothetical protein